jgi:2-polyprenyl-3-methyl-5-hydroxy-6-metoxy-1,4-benzoquinol methylase
MNHNRDISPPSKLHQMIVEANRQYYAKTATQYNQTETCVVCPQAQMSLQSDLDQILTLFGDKPLLEIKVLDACGGSGNVSSKLLEKGVDVTICDVSEDLLQIFKSECTAKGWQPQVIRMDILEYLSDETAKYDLIVFSSALHHLQDYQQLLSLAYAHLSSNGLIYTVFDPISRSSISALGKIIIFSDYLCFKLFSQTKDFPQAIVRRIKRTVDNIIRHSPKDFQDHQDINDASLGVLAEYHASKGINDFELIAYMSGLGAQVIWHQRYPDARHKLFRSVLSLLHQKTTFKLLIRNRNLNIAI